MSTARSVVLDEFGDLTAEPGSRPWAVAVRGRMMSLIDDTQSSAVHLRRSLEVMEKHAGYRVLEDRNGKPFRDYAAFCLEPPPFGLGYELPTLKRIVQERENAQKLAENPKSLREHGGDRKSSENQDRQSTLTGRNSDYRVARIARDRPDILERMKAGQYQSVRQAALEAGIVKRTCQHATTPESFANAARRHLSPDELTRLVALLNGEAL